MALLQVMGLTFVLNLPFGWWRHGARRFSGRWFAAIHAPVPMVVLLRHGFGVQLAPGTIPFLLGAYFLGQLAGARIRRRGAGGWTRVTPPE